MSDLPRRHVHNAQCINTHVSLSPPPPPPPPEPVWPSGKAPGRLVSGRTSVRYRFGSPFSSKVVVCGQGLVSLFLTINETLKRLSSLPILMQVILVVTV